MAAADIDDVRQTITDELNVLSDDIHVHDDGETLTFYVPTDQLEEARDVLSADVEVLETREHEYLVRLTV